MLVCRTLTVLLLIGVLFGHICLNSFLMKTPPPALPEGAFCYSSV